MLVVHAPVPVAVVLARVDELPGHAFNVPVIAPADTGVATVID